MRPETIVFSEDMPVRAFVGNVYEYPYHWHDALEIIVVLLGQVTIGMGGETHLLEVNNIAVINRDEPHYINKSSGDNKLLMLQIDSSFCERVNPDFKHAVFYCCSSYHEAETPERYSTLKYRIVHLVCLLNEAPFQKHNQAVKEYLEEMLSHMISSFDYLRFGSGIKAFEEKQVKRYREMYEHILKYPNKKQRLKELAEGAGVTLQHMSNDIKERYGYTFQELLYCIKCEHAARLLLSSNKMIYQISSECGFSDPKYLIKHFRLNYHHTPSDFRKLYKDDDEALASKVRYQEAPLSSALEYLKKV